MYYIVLHYPNCFETDVLSHKKPVNQANGFTLKFCEFLIA